MGTCQEHNQAAIAQMVAYCSWVKVRNSRKTLVEQQSADLRKVAEEIVLRNIGFTKRQVINDGLEC